MSQTAAPCSNVSCWGSVEVRNERTGPARRHNGGVTRRRASASATGASSGGRRDHRTLASRTAAQHTLLVARPFCPFHLSL